MDYIKHIGELISIEGIDRQEVISSVVLSSDKEKADYTLPCFKFSKLLKKSPAIIAEELKATIEQSPHIKSVEAINGYLNFKINAEGLAVELFKKTDKDFCKSEIGKGKTVCIDYSSINIAKPFHIGHLSTTVIGGALYRIYKHLGYDVVGINHLGDWGTQFGKLIVAYKKWGDKAVIEKGGIRAMLEIYVRFHSEAKSNPSLEEEGRSWFKKIEDGDKEALEIFEWFKKITLEEVSKIYELLGIKFDSYAGESFYNDKMAPVIDELSSKGLLKTSEGASVVDLEEYGMPPCLIVKGDGATLYATRDLAAAEYRKKTYDFYKCLYVVAYQQNLHFKQFFKVLELMGKPWARDLVHVPFGMVSFEGQALSTRKGNVVFLQEVMDSAIAKAYEIINEKSPNLEGKQDIAKKVGIGAVVFSALHSNKIKDISFSYDRVLSFEGETGPYVQYTYARCNSVLSKAKIGTPCFDKMTDIEESLLKQIDGLQGTVLAACEQNEPSMITRAVIEICKTYNKFYYDNRIIGEDRGIQSFRLLLTKATMAAIHTGFSLLGISLPTQM